MQAFLLAIFAKKIENSTRQQIFESWDGYSPDISYESKISSKSLYLARFLRYKHFL